MPLDSNLPGAAESAAAGRLDQEFVERWREELLAQAYHVIAMTRGHLRALAGHGGAAPRLLCDEEIPDPIGAPPEVYEQCARQILGAVAKLVPELQ